MIKNTVFSTEFDCWKTSVSLLLEASDFKLRAQKHKTILIKPNLVEALPPPVTTPVRLVRELISYIKKELPETRIIVGEGTGAKEYETSHCFEVLGYAKLADEMKFELLDLNLEPQIHKSNSACTRWPAMYLPAILDEVFLLSVPVLKVHTLADVTLTMKNMMGFPPPSHYQRGGYWKKSSFHHDIHHAIFDLNRYRTPDYTLLDATVGMIESHLWGATSNPPVNVLAAGKDPVAIDAYGSQLLGLAWQNIEYLAMADGQLGTASAYTVEQIEPTYH